MTMLAYCKKQPQILQLVHFGTCTCKSAHAAPRGQFPPPEA